MNVVDIILIILITVALIWAIFKTVRNSKNGTVCGGNCSQCNGCTCGKEKL